MTAPSAAAPRRVFLHVGSPKTGTTYLQNLVWAQRDEARAQGLLLPLERFGDHYLASVDVRGQAERPEHPPRAQGIWQRLVAEASAWSGTVLVSHELFGAAPAARAQAAVESFGEDTEVHVVLTARDLVRQITAEWQEHVKHRSSRTLAEFVADVRDDRGRTSWFWRVQDFSGVLRRWGGTLPPDRVHVVTVPPPGAPQETLWVRYATLLGLDPTRFDTEVPRSNTSLGLEQTEFLRRVNAALGDRLPLPGPYPVVAKNLLAHQILAQRPGTRLTLSEADAAYAAEQSAAVAERLGAMGVDVVGDLADLVPDPERVRAASSAHGYDVPADSVLLDEAVEVTVELLAALSRRRSAERRYEELSAELARSPLRFALVRASERRPWLMRARRAYAHRHDLAGLVPRRRRDRGAS